TKGVTYYIFGISTSSGDTCPDSETYRFENGAMMVDFEIDQVSDIMCKGGLGTISLDNFQYDPNDPFTLELYEGSNATPVYTEQLSSIPFNGYVIDQSKYELTENQY